MADGDIPSVQRLLLVGFMGSGKSAVGRALARRLGWTFLDIDEVVAEREGRSVGRIFKEDGEAYFRRREHDATLDQLREVRVVIATGGGWPAVPGRLQELGPGSVSVWLDVPVSVLEARLSGGAAARPLLVEANRRAQIVELLDRRKPFYGQATVAVDGTGSPGRVAERILVIIQALRGPQAKTRTQDPKS